MSEDDYPYCPECDYPLWTTPCQQCISVKKEKVNARKFEIECLGGEKAFSEFTQDNLIRTKNNSKILELCKNFDPRKHNLYLSGPTGSGKTHMAISILRNHWKKDYGKIHWRVPEILREIRGARNASDESDAIRKFGKKKLLLLDDLGVGKVTEWVPGVIWEIIDTRSMSGKGGLIITSNLTLDDLTEWIGNDRVSSRIAEMCMVFNLEGEQDWRLRRKK